MSATSDGSLRRWKLAEAQTIHPPTPTLWMALTAILALAVIGFAFLGDGLRDALDPRVTR